VAGRVVGPRGRVVGIDLRPLDRPIDLPNVFAFEGDLCESADLERLRSELGKRADVVLCDASPKRTGVRVVDRAREAALLEAVEKALDALLSPGGSLLLKLLDAPEALSAERRLRRRFASARVLRLRATRRGSRERYLLARGFRPAEAGPAGESGPGKATTGRDREESP